MGLPAHRLLVGVGVCHFPCPLTSSHITLGQSVPQKGLASTRCQVGLFHQEILQYLRVRSPWHARFIHSQGSSLIQRPTTSHGMKNLKIWMEKHLLLETSEPFASC